MIGAAGAGGSAVGGSVPVFGVFLVRIFPYSRWMRGGVGRGAPPGFSVFSPGAGDAGRGAPGAHFSRGGRFPFLGGGGWALGCAPTQFWRFSDISQFSSISGYGLLGASYRLFGNWLSNSRT